MSINIPADGATIVVHQHYRVLRATPRDSMVIMGLTRNNWSERVAISDRRSVEAASAVAEDMKRGGAFLLSRHNQPIGALIYVPAGSAAVWEIRRFGILTPYAGRGFTQMLMQAVEESARKRNLQALRVAVPDNRPSVRQYFESIGFRVISSPSFSTHFRASNQPIMLQKYLSL